MTYDDPYKLKLTGIFKKLFKNTEPSEITWRYNKPRLLTVCHLILEHPPHSLQLDDWPDIHMTEKRTMFIVDKK